MKNEKVILVVHGIEKQGRLFEKTSVYTLIISDKHIIAGRVGIIQPGIFGSGAVISRSQKKKMNHNKYDGMETEEIVSAGEHNYAFAYDELKEVAVKNPSFLKPFLKLVPYEGKNLHLILPEEAFSEVKKALVNQVPNNIINT